MSHSGLSWRILEEFGRVYRILLNFSQFFSILLNCTQLYSILLNCTQFYSIVLNFTQFCFHFQNFVVGRKCRALYDCEADNEDELTFEEGDIIVVINEDTEDENWMEGCLQIDPSRRGLFPVSFVNMLEDSWFLLLPMSTTTSTTIIF